VRCYYPRLCCCCYWLFWLDWDFDVFAHIYILNLITENDEIHFSYYYFKFQRIFSFLIFCKKVSCLTFFPAIAVYYSGRCPPFSGRHLTKKQRKFLVSKIICFFVLFGVPKVISMSVNFFSLFC
jgi:hypothetical protein